MTSNILRIRNERTHKKLKAPIEDNMRADEMFWACAMEANKCNH